jgi:pimeloyl-ACP methyl ester carboxylesterase
MHPAAPPLRRSYADGPHGQIHYYDGGGTGTPVLMLHQSPASSSDWFALVPLLASTGLRLLAMDTPGMGLSDPLPFVPTMVDYVDAVPVVLDHAGVAQADLLGHHTGVQIAIEAAVRYPARVRSAMLYGVPVMTAAEQEAYWHDIVPRSREATLHKPVPGGSNLTTHFQRLERLFGTIAAQRMLLSALIAGPLLWHGHNAALQHDMAPALLAATQPLLLISHPGEMLEANTQAAAALRPDARYVSIDTDAPIAMDGNPAALAAAIIDFLNDIKRRMI